MTGVNLKTPSEIRADAWRALRANGQYLRYVAAYLLLMLVMMVLLRSSFLFRVMLLVMLLLVLVVRSILL